MTREGLIARLREIEAARETLREMMAFLETLNKPNG